MKFRNQAQAMGFESYVGSYTDAELSVGSLKQLLVRTKGLCYWVNDEIGRFAKSLGLVPVCKGSTTGTSGQTIGESTLNKAYDGMLVVAMLANTLFCAFGHMLQVHVSIGDFRTIHMMRKLPIPLAPYYFQHNLMLVSITCAILLTVERHFDLFTLDWRNFWHHIFHITPVTILIHLR